MSKKFTDQEVVKELISRNFDFKTNAFPPRDVTNPKFSDLIDEELVLEASSRG